MKTFACKACTNSLPTKVNLQKMVIVVGGNCTHCYLKDKVGVDIVRNVREEHNYATRLAFKTTNNEAKYKVLLVRLTITESLGANEVEVKADS